MNPILFDEDHFRKFKIEVVSVAFIIKPTLSLYHVKDKRRLKPLRTY